MWLLYDDKNNLVTQLDHGSKPRQGSPLEINVCFSPSRSGLSAYQMTVDFLDSNGDTIQSATTSVSSFDSAKVFRKLSVGEQTYGFIDQQSYPCFSVQIPSSDEWISETYGKVTAVFKMTNRVTNAVDFYLANCSFTMERTFGSSQLGFINQSQYEKLLSVIGTMGVAPILSFKPSSEGYIGENSDNSYIDLTYFKGIGMIYGKFTMQKDSIVDSNNNWQWTTIASIDTGGAYGLKAKSVAVGNNSIDNDAEIRVVQNYTTVNGVSVPSTIDVQVYQAFSGNTVEFSSPIVIEYKDETSELDDTVFLRKAGGSMTGPLEFKVGSYIELNDTKLLEKGGFSVSIEAPTAESVIAYESWVSNQLLDYEKTSDLPTALTPYLKSADASTTYATKTELSTRVKSIAGVSVLNSSKETSSPASHISDSLPDGFSNVEGYIVIRGTNNTTSSATASMTIFGQIFGSGFSIPAMDTSQSQSGTATIYIRIKLIHTPTVLAGINEYYMLYNSGTSPLVLGQEYTNQSAVSSRPTSIIDAQNAPFGGVTLKYDLHVVLTA